MTFSQQLERKNINVSRKKYGCRSASIRIYDLASHGSTPMRNAAVIGRDKLNIH
jgi:hypothetical protein